MLPLIIVGGGMHGTIISLALSRYLPVGYHRVIDCHSAPLWRWTRNCHACGMRYLRSPAAHQLDTDPRSLLRFSRAEGHRHTSAQPYFIPLYHRPLFALFMRHAHHLIAQHHVDTFRVHARCHKIKITHTHIEAETDERIMRAQRVLICTGTTDTRRYPRWALSHNASCTERRRICHVFNDQFSLARVRRSRRILIIGGGITALQLASTLSDMATGAPPQITVLTRHALRYADFDSDPCYLGPACLKDFTAVMHVVEKRARIADARNRASIPPDIAKSFAHACRERRCALRIGEVASLSSTTESPYTMRLHSGEILTADAVVLATGFRNNAQENGLIHQLTHTYHLPCDEEGSPITDEQLRWHPRVLLSGGYAALTVGPAAGNIVGAHLALRRMFPLFLGHPYKEEYAWKPLGASTRDHPSP